MQQRKWVFAFLVSSLFTGVCPNPSMKEESAFHLVGKRLLLREGHGNGFLTDNESTRVCFSGGKVDVCSKFPKFYFVDITFRVTKDKASFSFISFNFPIKDFRLHLPMFFPMKLLL